MRTRKSSLVLCFCVVVGVNAGWAADDKAAGLQVLGGSVRLRAALQVAARVALQQLQTDECRRVFSAFKDSQGRTLQQNLDAIGQEAPEYLQRTIRFANGSAYTQRCQQRGIAALTQPGSHVVMLCETQFLKAVEDDTHVGGAIIIHETLHTLGLPENPPSAEEITAQVRARCK